VSRPTSRSSTALTIHPATPDRWQDLARLFGPRGACAGCWCMWPRMTGTKFRASRDTQRRDALRRVVRKGPPPGLLAYQNGEAIGWCAVAPRSEYHRLEGSRVMAPVNDQPTWSVVCFFVARGHRRQGLGGKLLEAAAKFAAENGARLIEGYPVDPAKGRTADAFVWTGLASTFHAAGFEEVARRSPTRPVMRRALKGVRPARARVARAKKPRS
jgi:GNAT superfamily N-acetyltransferase